MLLLSLLFIAVAASALAYQVTIEDAGKVQTTQVCCGSVVQITRDRHAVACGQTTRRI